MSQSGAQRAFSTRARLPNKPVVFNIGDVLSQLKDEFPAVSASKIRFFEEKGLITPQRTAAGYRQFSAQDVARLRFILGLQRDHYLPLKVIRDYLDAIDRGEGPQNIPPGVSSAVMPKAVDNVHEVQRVARARKLSAEQLRSEAHLSEELFGSLVSFGLIEAHNGGFDDNALKVARTCAALNAHGIQARHLRLFQGAARREFDLVEQAVRPLSSRKDAAAQARAAESAREISQLCLNLHTALVQDLISRLE